MTPEGDVNFAESVAGAAKFEASPTVADDKIYAIDHNGIAYVFGTGEDYELLHKTPMSDGRNLEIRSTIAVSGGNLFIRTDKQLFCIGK